jgi:hypothetical protein
MSAVGAEFGFPRDGLLALGTGDSGGRGRFALLSRFGKHGGHHHAQTHTHAGAGFTTRFSGLFHGHGCFHLRQPVQVVEEGQAAFVINGLLYLDGGSNRIDIELLKVQTKPCEIFLQPFLQPFGQLIVLARQIENGIEGFSHVVVEAGDDNAIQIICDLQSGVYALGSNEAVDEEYRLDHSHIEYAESTKANQAQLGILECHRVSGAPFEVGEHLHVHNVDFSPEWAGKPPGQAQNLCQDGNVGSGQSVPAAAKGIAGLAVVKEHRGLTLPYDQLGPKLDFSGTALRNPVNDFLSGIIKPFDYLQKYDVVRSHVVASAFVEVVSIIKTISPFLSGFGKNHVAQSSAQGSILFHFQLLCHLRKEFVKQISIPFNIPDLAIIFNVLLMQNDLDLGNYE